MPEGSVLRIMGIDPGTRNVGWAIVDAVGGRITCVAHASITAQNGDIAQRLVEIYQGLAEAVEKYTPAVAAVETVFAKVNPKTAIAIGEGRGVALLAVAQKGVPVVGYEPALVKRVITGSGRADKDQVQRMIQAVLRLEQAPETDHESDALALAVTHARRCTPDGSPLPQSLPARRRRRPLPEQVLRYLPLELRQKYG